jgi:predicted acetyltransferase
MYRIVDIAEILDRLAGHGFAFGKPGSGARPCTLKLTVDDSFLPENAGSHLLHFENGRLRRLEGGPYDAELRLDIAGFSSLLAGTVTFKALYQYGMADISDPGCVESASRVFAVDQKPVCTTQF